MRKPILVVVSVALLVAGFAVVSSRAAAHGGDPNLIHACVNNNSGEIKIVDVNEPCEGNSTALDWNPQHPIVVLPGENGVDLSGLDCDPEILFANGPRGQARLVYECAPEAFSFRVPDGADGETRIFSVSDGLLNLRGMSSDPVILVPHGAMTINGGEFVVFGGDKLLLKVIHHTEPNGTEFHGLRLVDDERGQAAMSYRTDLNEFGWTVPIEGLEHAVLGVQNGLIHMYGSTRNERSIGFAFPQAELAPARLFYNVEQEAYHFHGPNDEYLKLEEGLIKAENSSIRIKLFEPPDVPSCSDPDIAEKGFVFWRDDSGPERVVKIVLRMGSECFVAPMALTSLP